jgi:hypothetical protein
MRSLAWYKRKWLMHSPLRQARPLVPNYETQNSKCFIWCRLTIGTPFFLSLSCTEVVPKLGARRSALNCPASQQIADHIFRLPESQHPGYATRALPLAPSEAILSCCDDDLTGLNARFHVAMGCNDIIELENAVYCRIQEPLLNVGIDERDRTLYSLRVRRNP